MADPYLVAGSDVLANLHGIADGGRLRDVEAELAFVRGLEVLLTKRAIPVTMLGLRAIHKVVFRDTFEWAGEYRTVKLTDRDGTDDGYSAVADIEADGDAAMKKIDSALKLHYSGKRSLSGVIPGLAAGYLALNDVHPFRDGNGRAQKIFFAMICRTHGFTIDWALVPTHEHTPRALLKRDRTTETTIRHLTEMTYVGGDRAKAEIARTIQHEQSRRVTPAPGPRSTNAPGPIPR